MSTSPNSHHFLSLRSLGRPASCLLQGICFSLFSTVFAAQIAPTASIVHTGSGAEIQWDGTPNTAYWVETSTGLTDWNELPEVALGGAGVLSRSIDVLSTDTFYRINSKPSILGEAFDSDPRGKGWRLINQAREIFPTGGWTAAESLRPGAYIWQSAEFTIPASRYFRVDFSHRGTGSLTVASQAFNPSLNWGRYPSIHATDGQLLEGDTSIRSTGTAWQRAVFVSRQSRHATTTAVQLSGTGVEIDNVVVTALSDAEALAWADAVYAQMPALNYQPPSGRHENLSRTLSRLQTGQPLRILFVGDSLMQDSANSTLDLLLERRFPGSTVEIQAATGQGTGINKWNDDPNYNWPDQDLDVDHAIIEQQPDLVLLGGISNNFTNWNTSFPELITKIRTRSIARWGSAPDIMLLTGPPFYSPQNNYNTDLSLLAENESTAFLDLYAVVDAYVANAGGSLSITDLKRDAYHANSLGKQLFGRVLLEWLEPEPSPLFRYADDESVVMQQSFAVDPAGWSHAQTLVQNGELVATPGGRWSEAVFDLDQAIPLTECVCNFYWEMRTDRAAGEDISALHIKMHVTRDPARFSKSVSRQF